MGPSLHAIAHDSIVTAFLSAILAVAYVHLLVLSVFLYLG